MQHVPTPTTGDILLLGDAAAQSHWRDALVAEGLGAQPAATTAEAAGSPRAALLCVQGALPPSLPSLRQLREAWPALPLVVLCRAPREVDQLLALELGADAVLPDGCTATLLAAQLRALWRLQQRAQEDRSSPAAADITASLLRFGSLHIDREQRRVMLGSRLVALTEGEFELLWLLASHGGQPLSRQQMQQHLHGHATVAGRAIDSCIYRLRTKLGDRAHGAAGSPGHPGIRTLRHHGYLFAPGAW